MIQDSRKPQPVTPLAPETQRESWGILGALAGLLAASFFRLGLIAIPSRRNFAAMVEIGTLENQVVKRLTAAEWRARIRAAKHSVYQRSVLREVLQPMARQDELAAIAAFIAEHGVARITLTRGGGWKVTRVRG